MNNDNEYIQLPDEICEALLIELFELLTDLLQQVAPQGFANSALVLAYHPTPAHQYEEYKRFHERLVNLQKSINVPDTSEPLKSFEEYARTLAQHTPVEEQFELVSIFGKCLWKVFSNNHTVYNGEGESYELGSWRGTGGYIADVIDKLQLVPGKAFDYMDFYMGDIWIEDKADLTPVYELIFNKLKAKGVDWTYSFPRMSLLSFKNNEEPETKPEEYDATKAVEKQLNQQKADDEIDKLQQQFDGIHDEAYEQAKDKRPSPEVMAYFNVYGHWPAGHPLSDV